VVCTANVCRSRAGELLLRRFLAAAGVDALVSSAGVRASAGSPSCATMLRLLGEHAVGAQPPQAARPVTRGLLAEHDLVLVSERAHRAALARLLPAARSRTFTLLEAAALADTALEDTTIAGRPGAPADDSGGPALLSSREQLRERVRLMDLARGKAQLPVGEVRARGLRAALRGAVEEPLDVLDVHGQSVRAHRRALLQIDDSLSRLVRGLTR
jgi:protein-tyrosine phosphatase